MSQLCDRNTTNVAKSQLGFIDFIVKPSFEQLIKVCPRLQHLMVNLNDNKLSWSDLIDEYETYMKEGNVYANK